MEGRGLVSLVSKALPPRVLCYLGYPDPAGGGRRGGGVSEEEDKVQSLSLRELLVHRNPLPLVYLALVYQWSC